MNPNSPLFAGSNLEQPFDTSPLKKCNDIEAEQHQVTSAEEGEKGGSTIEEGSDDEEFQASSALDSPRPPLHNHLNQHQNRLYVDMDWENDITADVDYMIIECYRKLDPNSFTDIYDDIYLKRYATALIKRQWGANLSKFSGVAMLGGVTMNGETIFSQATEELEKLEEQIQLAFELPINYMIG